jgi:hypothetical protein
MCAAGSCLGTRGTEMTGQKRLHPRIIKTSIGDLHSSILTMLMVLKLI